MKEKIQKGKTYLGIELGSTRIKTVLIDDESNVIATGSYQWENSLINGLWTYGIDEIWTGLQASFTEMTNQVSKNYGVCLETVGAIGFSAMMHGYMAFDKNGELLVPFRTWRNTNTEEAALTLSDKMNCNIPLRWSVSHVYQAILDKEEHINQLAYMTTLAGYIHWKLTGHKVLGIGDASGMFPIDSVNMTYDKEKLAIFDSLVANEHLSWKLEDILPKILLAGEQGGLLSAEGAKLLDCSGKLKSGIPICPPEGDAGTGMVATNSVAVRTGNVSAGTSVFAMIVLENQLKKMHKEIDMVTTPSGDPVAMVHCNNCTSEINAWASMFKDFVSAAGFEISTDKLYETLFNAALQGDKDCGGLMSYNYVSGEPVTGFNKGIPLFLRGSQSHMNLANFMRTQLYSALGALKCGMDILLDDENVTIDEMYGHGGYFKTPIVGQTMMSAAINTPVTVTDNAGEGGAWGMAVLAQFMAKKDLDESLGAYLKNKVFNNQEYHTLKASDEDVAGFRQFINEYKKCLDVEAAATKYVE
jgi:sugar (pentulose or hexulose) kinase